MSAKCAGILAKVVCKRRTGMGNCLSSKNLLRHIRWNANPRREHLPPQRQTELNRLTNGRGDGSLDTLEDLPVQ